MPFLTDLADACRKSGLEVVEVDGWRTRGHGSMSSVDTIVCHHTATPRSASGDYPSLRIVRDGRAGLPGPLAQLGLGRDGTVYVIAAGVAWHAGVTFNRSQDNWHAIGIEAEADGVSSWPAAQYDAYARLCAALCDHYRLPVSRVQGHKEVASPRGRKIDPNFDMDRFREAVEQAGDDDMSKYEEQLNRIEATQKKILARLNPGGFLREKLNKIDRELDGLGSDAATKAQAKKIRREVADLRAALEESESPSDG